MVQKVIPNILENVVGGGARFLLVESENLCSDSVPVESAPEPPSIDLSNVHLLDPEVV